MISIKVSPSKLITFKGGRSKKNIKLLMRSRKVIIKGERKDYSRKHLREREGAHWVIYQASVDWEAGAWTISIWWQQHSYRLVWSTERECISRQERKHALCHINKEEKIIQLLSGARCCRLCRISFLSLFLLSSWDSTLSSRLCPKWLVHWEMFHSLIDHLPVSAQMAKLKWASTD